MSETRDREPDRTQGTGPSGATGAPRRLWKAQYVFLLILAVGVLVTLYVTQVRREKCVKIGAVLSLSGGTAYVGEEVRDGMLLAVDEVNAWDGIQGRQIELIIEDCQTDVEKGQEAFNRIEAAHQPVLYISTLSSISIALAPLAEENQVVLIGMAATAPELTGQNEWVFRYFPTARDEVPPILAILEELRVTELGMIYVDDAYGRSFSELAKREFEQAGGTVRAEPVAGGNDDFRQQIARLKDTDAIYIVVYPGHMELLFKQLREEHYAGFIVGAGNVSAPAIRNLPETEGVYVVAPIIYSPGFLYAKEVREKYESRYGKPFNHYAASGYDIIKLLAGLLEDEEISRQGIKHLLEQGFIYPGVFGELHVEPGEHDIGFPLYPAQIVGSEVEYR